MPFILIKKYFILYSLSQFFTRYCGSRTKYISKIDDDTVVDFDLLDKLLAETDMDARIVCPTVMRNQKPWRHPQAKVMGKWTNLVEGILRRYFSIKLI